MVIVRIDLVAVAVLAGTLAACGGGDGGRDTTAPADAPDAVDAADVADLPDLPDRPEATDDAEPPDAPDVPDVPDAPDVPDVPPPFVGPLDDVLRLNHLQVKGTHNSYHVESPGALAQWRYTHAPLDVQLESQGVRQVELDVHWDPDLPGFTVHHIPLADPGTTCETFKGCLQVVKGWSDAHPGHAPLFVLVEPKDDVDDVPITGHLDDLDAEIRSVFPPASLLTPDDVRGAHATLKEALEQDGWPTLGKARGRTMFVMLDDGAHRAAYLEGHPMLEGRPIFARGGFGEPWATVMEHGNPIRDAEAIRASVAAGYLVRTSSEGVDETDEVKRAGAAAALDSGANLVSTDFPVPVTEGGYSFELNGGTPVRCNRFTAPDACRSAAVEAFRPYPRVSPSRCARDRGCRHAMVSCHRGDHQHHPENSLAGIRGVAEAGADAVEVDLRATKDDVLVLMHDSEVDRTTDGTGKIEDKTWAEVEALTLDGAPVDDPAENRVPRFLDALKVAKEKDLLIYLDLMTGRLDLLYDALKNGEGGPYFDHVLVRDGLDTTSAFRVMAPEALVMPYVQSQADLEALLAVIPDVPWVETWVGGPDPALVAAIHAAGARVTQDVLGTGDLLAGMGDYSLWGQFLEAGVDLPQTDWPYFFVPPVSAYNDTMAFPAEGPTFP